MQLVQIKVKRISHLKADPNCAILELQEVSGERSFSIVIGMEEAAAIAAYVAHIKLDAPLIHDLFKNTLDAFHILLKRVVVTELVLAISFNPSCEFSIPFPTEETILFILWVI